MCCRKCSLMFLLIGLSACGLLLPGCSNKPQGYPKVYECTVHVVANGKPVPNALVSLIPDGESTYAVSLVINGRTDETGAAVIQTCQGNYGKKGGPLGKYIVTIKEQIELIDRHPPGERERVVHDLGSAAQYAAEVAEMNREAIANKVVPDRYEKKASSPLRMEISGKTEETFDVTKENHPDSA